MAFKKSLAFVTAALPAKLCEKNQTLSKSSLSTHHCQFFLSKSSHIFEIFVEKTRSDLDKMSTGRGGARHVPKPYIDVMLVYDALDKHRGILLILGDTMLCQKAWLWIQKAPCTAILLAAGAHQD